MTKDKIRDFLLSREERDRLSFRESRESSNKDHLSRRQFITLVGIGGCAASFDIHGQRPIIVEDGRSISVKFGGFFWRIDPDAFSGTTRVDWSYADNEFLIELQNATLPGTDFSVPFVARIFERFSEWKIGLSMPEIRFRAEATLSEWISGKNVLRSEVYPRELRFGGKSAQLIGSEVTLALDPFFNFLLEGERVEIKHPSGWVCSGKKIVLRPKVFASDSMRFLVERKVSGPSTFVSLSNPVSNRAIVLNPATASHKLRYEPLHIDRLSGEIYDLDAKPTGILLVEGSGLLGSFAEPGTRQIASGYVNLENVALLVSSGATEFQTALAGRMPETPQQIHFGCWGAVISGDPERPFYANFASESASAVLDATLHRLNLPIQDADLGYVAAEKRAVKIVFTLDSPSGNPKKSFKKPQCGSIIILGNKPVAIDACVNLDETKLTIRRAVDCFNLSFEFVNFDLRVQNGTPILRRRRSKNPRKIYETAYVIVNFPAQHIAETFFPFQDPTTLPADSPPQNKEFGARPLVTRSRLSGGSRLVFSPVDDRKKKPKWVERPITIEALTNWSELSLCVNSRALPRGSSLEQQLGVAGITCDMSLKQLALQVAAEMQPPSSLETSLEMSGRLILSPSGNARWRVPVQNRDQNRAVLWHARLDDESRRNVRALWSNWLIPGHFPEQLASTSADCDGARTTDSTALAREGPSPGSSVTRDPVARADELLVLTPSDHWELIAQTSLYGLVAIRNLQEVIEPAKGKNGSAKKKVVGIAETRKLSNRVIPPDDSFRAIEELAQDPASQDPATHNPTLTAQDLGFAVVEPFDDGNVILTSMGGSLGAEWNGEPFDIPKNSVMLPKPFNLERFVYRSQIGRDIHVETYRKGYLLPLGVRASYVRLSERRFAPHPRYGYPVCYLIQRTFIVIRKPEKSYPAVKQPYDSRDFPVSKLVMLTRVTPDLISPCGSSVSPTPTSDGETNTGRLYFSGLANDDLVFWPRVKRGLPGTDGDVEFKWTIDDDKTPITSNLLFVSNSVARDSEKLVKVANYYRKKGLDTENSKWNPLVVARLSGTRHQYAVPNSSTETSFDTDSWLMSLRGAYGQAGSGESFATDSTLEIADQPPVYPVVSKSRLSVQTLDHFMREPHGLIEVRFWPQYIANGFSESNPSQIFLEVLSPAISLNANNNGAATGGLGRPNTTLAALSRTTGLVGGRDTNVTGVANSTAPLPNGQLIGRESVASGRFDFANASIGKFDPSEYFAPDAKILGLVSFRDLLRGIYQMSDAPKLLEKYQYGEVAAKSVVVELCKKLQIQRKILDSQIGTVLSGLTIKDLYPNLSRALDELCTMPSSPETSSVEYVSAMAYKAREVVIQVEQVLSDPLPTLASRELDMLKGLWEQIRNAPTNWVNQYAASLFAPFNDLVAELAGGIGALQATSSLTGSDKSSYLEDLIGLQVNKEDPSRWQADVRRTIFAPVLGLPLAAAYAKLNSLRLPLPASMASGISDAGRLLSECIFSLGDALFAAVQFADSAASGALIKLWNRKSSQEAAPASALLRLAVSDSSNATSLTPGSEVPNNTENLFTYPPALLIIGKGLKVIRPDLKERLTSARTDFVAACEILEKRSNLLTDELNTFVSVSNQLKSRTTDRSFSGEVSVLGSAASVITKRREVIYALQSIATILPNLELIVEADHPPLDGSLRDLQSAGDKIAAMLLSVSNINQIASGSTVWTDANAVLAKITDAFSDVPALQKCFFTAETDNQVNEANKVIALTTLSKCLDEARVQIEKQAQSLFDRLKNRKNLAELAKLDVSKYVDDVEGELYALSLPAISFPLTESAILLQAVVNCFADVVGTLADLYHSVADTFVKLIEHLHAPIVRVLFDPKVEQSLVDVAADLKLGADSASAAAVALKKLNFSSELSSLKLRLEKANEQDEIKRLSGRVAEIADDLRSALRNLQKASFEKGGSSLLRGDSIGRAWSVFHDILGQSLLTKLGTAFTREKLNEILVAMRDTLRRSLLELLPTAKEVKYDWSTDLGDFNAGSFFTLTFLPPPDKTKHLTLSGRDKFNFVTGINEAAASAVITPFKIGILGLIELVFDGASFDSRNGSDSHLNVKFNDVIIKDGLKFLEALQKFMSPSEGSGPYVIVNAAAVRAGYRYDASVLQVGSLQFIHVSLNVFTHIPLRGLSDGDLSAQIGFGFGTEDRPFLIAQPPYGGGGFVELIFRAGKLIPRISLSFGAVVSFHFGPLKGHGRITSTITWGRNRSDTADVIKATVEAVGEGNIGCFGISVMLQVGLFQEGSNLEGFARYSFEFSIGSFFKLSFSVAFHYQIAGGSSSQSQASNTRRMPSGTEYASGAVAHLAETGMNLPTGSAVAVPVSSPSSTCTQSPSLHKITLLAPLKANEWGRYRKRLAMELL